MTGYIVSAYSRKTAGGAVGFSVVVQSSTTLPDVLEQRCEAWLTSFREELESTPPEEIAQEAGAVVAQLLERNMRFNDEVSTAWGSIVSTSVLGNLYNTPPFDRHERLADELKVDGMTDSDKQPKEFMSANDLKRKILALWDKYFDESSPQRRVLSARVYGHKAKDVFEKNKGRSGYMSNYNEVRQVKQFLEQYPTAPYWIKKVNIKK